jgi:precorrin-6A/cobalt-precorrin-6A reductase
LILGGTSEARVLAQRMADAGIKAVYSYAGRVAGLAEQPVPVRVGGFGGVDGLVAYLRENGVTHVVDATHPFAAGMSRNAVEACARAGLPLVALGRAPWVAQAGDYWQCVADMEAAVAALKGAARRVFLAIGRQNLSAFADQPQHHYLLRLVNAPDAPVPLPRHIVEVARGPFSFEGDLALIRDHKIDVIVAKNAGGEAARAKLDAACVLGLPVIMIDRPALPVRAETHSVEDVMRWLHGATDLGV